MRSDLVLNRKLAAILAADVVGYSRLMEADETATLRQLQELQKSCVAPILASFGGRLIKTTGDGFLFEFSSAVSAVLFAIELQRRIQVLASSIAEERRLVLRIGIHAGDIMSDGIDMFGDGVNVAARLETMCVPGGICLSAVVQEQLHGKVELPLVDLGKCQVKNISRTIHAFGIEAGAISTIRRTEGSMPNPAATEANRLGRGRRVAGAVAVAAVLGALLLLYIYHSPTPTAAVQDAAAPSIAVLPFTSVGDEARRDDTADALVENLTTSLSVGTSMTVIASASAFTYRGKTIDPRQVGRDLGVKYLVTGSVQRLPDRVRVSIHLIDARSASQLWSDSFDGAVIDVAAMQDQITSAIANALQVQLVRVEAARRQHTTNVSAQDLIFRGEATLTRAYSIANFDAIEACFRQALRLDPDNMTAMIDLGQLLAIRFASEGKSNEPAAKSQLNEAKQLLDRARALDPRDPDVHNGLGLVYLYMDRVHDAEAQFRAEIEINRNAAAAYTNLGSVLVLTGHPAEAVPLIEKSLRLNPRDPHISSVFRQLMMAYFAQEKYQQAIDYGERAYGTDGSNPALMFFLAATQALLGRRDEAKAALAEGLQLQPGFTLGKARDGFKGTDAFAVQLARRYQDGLKLAGLPE